MAVAANLIDAANKTPQNLRALWEASTLQAKMIAFWQAVNDDFDDSIPNDRPIGAWLAIIAAFAPTIQDYDNPVAQGSITTFSTSVDYIYRLFKFAGLYPLLTVPQDTALLAAYNAQFA